MVDGSKNGGCNIFSFEPSAYSPHSPLSLFLLPLPSLHLSRPSLLLAPPLASPAPLLHATSSMNDAELAHWSTAGGQPSYASQRARAHHGSQGDVLSMEAVQPEQQSIAQPVMVRSASTLHTVSSSERSISGYERSLYTYGQLVSTLLGMLVRPPYLYSSSLKLTSFPAQVNQRDLGMGSLTPRCPAAHF